MLRFLTTLALLTAFLQAFTQSADTLKRIDALFASWNNSTPGGAVMVSRGDKIIYDKAFGLADLEHQVPNLTNTIFEAGSVSKQFTATSALMLILEGKLNLEDDVRQFIPELPDYDAPVRVKHLLTHTSGLKDWGSIAAIGGWPRTTRVYTQDQALQIICRQKSLNFTPGAEYSYSNSNYTLLVFIVERLSGKSLADFTREKLFEPAGMKDTQWRDNFRKVVPHRAVAYERRGGKYEQVMPFENTHGHGGLLTTTADLTKWNEQLVTRAIGGDALYNLRIKQGVLNNMKTISYASGIVINKTHGLLDISHSGATAGYRAYLLSFPERKLSIAILSNDGSFNAPAAGNAIADILLGSSEKATMKKFLIPTASELKSENWAGVYKSARGFDVVTLESKNNRIFMDGDEGTLLHRDTLAIEQFRLIRKTTDGFLFDNGQDTSTYIRVKPADIGEKTLKSYAGRYRSNEADCTFNVEFREGKLFLVNAPFKPIALEPSFLDGFRIDGYDLVQFRRSKGTITGFDLSTSRAENVPFIRQKE